MKKILALLVCLIYIAGSLTACADSASNTGIECTTPVSQNSDGGSASGSGSGSADGSADGSGSGSDGKIKIVTTIFPIYDWVREIVGENSENIEISMLLDNGVDLHSFQPTADDIIKIASCDMFIYVGGDSDGWVKDALKKATNKDMVVVNLMEILGDKAIGHDHDHEHGDHDHDDHGDDDHDDHGDDDHGDHGDDDHDDHGDDDHDDHDDHGDHGDDDHDDHGDDDHDDHGDDDHGDDDHGDHGDDDHDDHGDDDHDHDHDHEHCDHHHEFDEHVWLSLKNAMLFCHEIAEKLAEVDAKNADSYESNAHEYIEKLEALDDNYEEAIEHSAKHTLLFGDRFPFIYLVKDYGLEYFAAFSGCSAETEASFETITFLAGKLDEFGLGTVLIIDGTTHKIAETIINNSKAGNQQILKLDSMQSTTSSDVESGSTYLSIMEKNLEVIKEALK